jgi:hypothetical protein
MDEGEERVRRASGPEKYLRLQRLKSAYDPENVLRHNQNIPPLAQASWLPIRIFLAPPQRYAVIPARTGPQDAMR